MHKVSLEKSVACETNTGLLQGGSSSEVPGESPPAVISIFRQPPPVRVSGLSFRLPRHPEHFEHCTVITSLCTAFPARLPEKQGMGVEPSDYDTVNGFGVNK